MKVKIEQWRMQRVLQGLSGETGDSGQEDVVEEKLRVQIEEEKRKYNAGLKELKLLKSEIEHLHHLLEKAKLRLHKEFKSWWTTRRDDALFTQEPQWFEEPQSPKTLSKTPHEQSVPRPNQLLPQGSNFTAGTEIPLTGDSKIDADILAFVQARQAVLRHNDRAKK
uniref:Kinesin-like protein KIF6/9 C-terminal domain-containing protein n=1 Tax=Eptatretus burgeri TaxID=7764 RepID=A0A8C4R191_EPTBU